MANPASARICGGRMEIRFRAVAATEDGEAVVHLSADCALWDGQPVSEVVAEALAVTWFAAQDDD
ncbi:hypothetical protein ACGFNY_45480 [Streptomyces chartreusis]|uniref:hypothetical protein n=1 Tax=Streptomyces chartreusis TaxID=1969 RepID=UPI003714550A